MLATETQAIADLLRNAMIDRYGEADVQEHFADTADTLCYATNENQNATIALIEDGADLALVVGGYNSSNTSHLVELCEARMPTYFIRDAGEILPEHPPGRHMLLMPGPEDEPYPLPGGFIHVVWEDAEMDVDIVP